MIYLVEYGIVHGDLACRNVLVFRFNHSEPQENLVKLTDFGLTRASSLYSVVGSTASTTLAVVPLRYAAPEILQSSGLSNYSEKSDVYTMGVLMWEACSQGQLPYVSIEDENEVRRRKLAGEILSKPDNCNDALWNIIVRCWNQRPEARPTFKMLKQLLMKHNTYTTNIPFNEIHSTTMIGCDFCNKNLPELHELIHNQVSSIDITYTNIPIFKNRLLLNLIFLDGNLVKMEYSI